MPVVWLLVLSLGLTSVQDRELPPRAAGNWFIDPLVLDPWSQSMPWEYANYGPFLEVDGAQIQPWYAVDAATNALNPLVAEAGMRELFYLASDDWLGLLADPYARAPGLAGANRLGPWGMPASTAGVPLQQGVPGAARGIRQGTGAQGQGRGDGTDARSGRFSGAGKPGDGLPGTGLPGAGLTGTAIGPATATGSPLESLFQGAGALTGVLIPPASLRAKGISKETALGVLSQFRSPRSRPTGSTVPDPDPAVPTDPVVEPTPEVAQPTEVDPAIDGNPQEGPDPVTGDAPQDVDPQVLATLTAAFQALDGNQDGEVSLVEAQAGKTLPMAAFKLLDVDKNQTVTQAEFDAGAGALATRTPNKGGAKNPKRPAPALPANAIEDFFLLDTDGDGAVSSVEYNAGRLPAAFFLNVDADKDRRVVPDEFTAHAAQAAAALVASKNGDEDGTPALPEAEARALFRSLDNDQDQRVTFEEFAAAGSLPARFFTHVDANDDEALTELELIQAPALPGRSDAGDDAAGSSRRTEEEIDAVLTQLPSSILRRIFTTLDLNHDEVVNRDEFAQSELLPPEVFRRFDADKDDVIQKAEFLAVVESLSADG